MADDNTKLIIVLEAQSKKLQNSLVEVNRNIDRFAAQTERRFEAMQKKTSASFDKISREMKGSLGGLQSLLGPLIGTLGAREVIKYADAWQAAKNKIAAASQVAGIQGRSLEELKNGANGARIAFGEYVDLYSRLLRTAPSVAASELQIAQATDIVAKSLKAGGASAQEQEAALIQLGQALGSGILQGDELRSIRENAPLIAKALAKEFNVSIGELKQLGAEGKLTSKKVFAAILAGGDDIEKAFKATRSTIGEAFTVIENNFTQYVGSVGQSSGATKALIDSLVFLAENFKTVGDAVVTFAAVLGTVLAGKAIAGVVIGLGEAVVALATFLSALSAGTLTMAIFSAALGPIAILAAAAAVTVGYLVYAHGDAARAAEQHAAALNMTSASLGSAIDGSQKFRDALKHNIEVQLAAARAALTESEAQYQAAAARALALKSLTGVPMLGAFANMAGDASLYQADGLANVVSENKKYISQIEDQLSALNKIMQTPAGPDGSATDPSGDGKGAEKWKKKTDSIIDQTEALIAQTNAQKTLNPLVNDYGYAVDKARIAEELRVAAMDAGVKMTPELRAQIEFLADGYATASVEAKKLAESQDEARQKAQEFFGGLKDVTRGWIDDLIAGKSAAEALGNALSNIGSRLIDMGLDSVFGTGSGKNPYGLLGQLFFHKNGGIAANGRPKTFSQGGVSKSAAIFGEAGPEAAVPLPDGRSIPVDLRMPGAAAGAVTIAMPISIDASGADASAIARLERGLAQMKAELPSRVVGAVRDAKKKRQL